MEIYPLKNAVTMSHMLLQGYVQKARVLVDMTCGNGHDTVFLAQHMPEDAHLYAFDIQTCAVASTRGAIKEAGLGHKHIIYKEGSHDGLVAQIEEPIDIAVFNLGYLPSGDHSIYTQSATTIKACKICLNKVTKTGIIMLAAYPGTEAGAHEQSAVHEFMQSIPQTEYDVSFWKPLNQIHHPPVLYIIQKRG